MIEHVLAFVLPAAFALLPEDMCSAEATAMLIAIGLQESKFQYRRQISGPARSFWQFEEGGLHGVRAHPQTFGPIAEALRLLRYSGSDDAFVLAAIEHHDTLAACFARCLLWTLPAGLPGPNGAREGWQLYTSAWRPGTPRPETWLANYTFAWTATMRGRKVPPEIKT